MTQFLVAPATDWTPNPAFPDDRHKDHLSTLANVFLFDTNVATGLTPGDLYRAIVFSEVSGEFTSESQGWIIAGSQILQSPPEPAQPIVSGSVIEG